jgi:hypothetical protein
MKIWNFPKVSFKEQIFRALNLTEKNLEKLFLGRGTGMEQGNSWK